MYARLVSENPTYVYFESRSVFYEISGLMYSFSVEQFRCGHMGLVNKCVTNDT